MFQALIDEEIAGGFYPNAEAVVADAVKAHVQTLRRLRASLDEAEAEYRRDGGIDGDQFMQDMVRGLEALEK